MLPESEIEEKIMTAAKNPKDINLNL